MSRRFISILILPVAVVLGVAATQSPKGAQSTSVPGDSSLLTAREAAWRDYFSGGKNLATVLPPDFVAIHAGDTATDTRAKTLEGSKASAASGLQLVRLAFPKNIIQRHGNVAVIHSRYDGTLRDAKGKTEQMKGWITETFYWDGTRWMHPSWHMSEDGKK
jgi:hypothetical protein